MTATVAGIHLGIDTHANRPAANTAPDGSFYSCSTHGLIYKSSFAGNSWATWATLGAAAPSGSITASGYTQSTARLLGRTTGSTGAIEEITVGAGLTLSAGSLTASAAALASAAYRATSGGDYTQSSGTYADIDGTNLSLTMTTGAHRVMVTLTAFVSIASTNACNIDVLVDGSGIGGNGAWQYRGNPQGFETVTYTYITAALTAASHTIKLQWKVNGGTMTIVRSGGATPVCFTIEEMGI